MLDRYGDSGVNYLKTTVIRGYKLYDLGMFPAAVLVADTIPGISTEMTVDLFEVNTLCWNDIEQMEKGSGYYEDLISIDDVFYSIFLMDEDQVKGKDSIQAGDWKKYDDNQVQYYGF